MVGQVNDITLIFLNGKKYFVIDEIERLKGYLAICTVNYSNQYVVKRLLLSNDLLAFLLKEIEFFLTVLKVSLLLVFEVLFKFESQVRGLSSYRC